MKKLFTTLFLMVTMLVFLSACSTQASLVDTKWQLTSLAGKSPLPDAKITLNFSKDAIGGSDGCNTYGGSYKSVKDTITFGNDIFSTMMYCTDEIAVQYQAYYEMLNQTATYKINDGVLSLMDAKGIVLAEFTASQD